MQGRKGGTKQEKEEMQASVRRVARANPEMSAHSIGARLGISHVTARRYLKLAGIVRVFDKKKGECVDASEA